MAGASVFRQTTTQFVNAELSPAARSKLLANLARKGLADLVSSGRASPFYRRFVDGNEGAQEDTVNGTDGVIVYQFSYVAETVAFALSFLQARSPVQSGRFRDSFIIAVDGRPIPAAAFAPQSVPLGAEIIIYSPLPQERQIDVQIAGDRPLRFSVPSGLFDDCVSAVRQRFGNTVKASRVYTISIPAPYILKRGKSAGSPVQTPALILTPLGL